MIVCGSLVVDWYASLCEDGRIWLFWYTLADGRAAVQSYTLGEAMMPAIIVEGMTDDA